MENTIKYAAIYSSYIDAASELEPLDRLAFYEAIFNYVLNGEEPIFENNILKMAFKLVKPNLDSNINNMIKNQQNGKKGGRPPKNNTSTKQLITDSIKENKSDISDYKPETINHIAKVQIEPETISKSIKTETTMINITKEQKQNPQIDFIEDLNESESDDYNISKFVIEEEQPKKKTVADFLADLPINGPQN